MRLLGLLIEPEHVPSLMTELCPLGSLHTLLFGGGATSLPTTSLGACPPAPASAAAAAAASVPRHGAGLPLLSWRRRLELAQQLVSGVAYLHGQSPPLIHRDLKPHNCLLDAKGAPKVADYPSPLAPRPSPLAPRPSPLTTSPDPEPLWLTGDCRAVICRGGEAIALTEDHRCESEAEVRRVATEGLLTH